MKLNIPEQIETERLLLRKLRYEYAEQIFYVYASKPEATKFMSWPTHQDISATRSFLKLTTEGWKKGTEFSFGIFLKDGNRLVGSFGIVNDNGKFGIGYVLGPLHWGKGYATEACKAMITILKSKGYAYRIGTFVDAENKASINVLQKCGFVKEASLEKWFRFINQDNQPKDCVLFKLE